MTVNEFINEPWVRGGFFLLVVLLAAVAAHAVFFAVLRRSADRTDRPTVGFAARHFSRPLLLLFPLGAVLVVWPLHAFPDEVESALRRGAVLLFVGAIGWAIVAAIRMAGDYIAHRYTTDHADNLDARRIQTQTQVLGRVAVVVTVLITAGIMLMSIPSIRHVGISLFASAGIAGLAVGLAARATLSNIIAGIQVALTQPIRLDDVVIVEGEWGWIEEIRTTYVVVRVWDLRRLVVPISYFVEKPFQNWTRTSADILGTVFIQMDYTVPFDAVRAEFRRILEASDRWDGKVCVMHVTEARERTVEVRALMSAANSPDAWELRCLVREKLLEFVRESWPGSLPRLRAEVQQAA